MNRYALLAVVAVTPAHAAVLEAGPGKPYDKPSAAIAKAHDGDTIRIAPGIYEDCAIIRQNGITVEAATSATLTTKTCGEKAILVITGTKVTIRGLTLANAKVPDRNGAGIRAEGRELLIENTTLLNNENGVLINANPAATVLIRQSTFAGNGHCDPVCAHGIYAGHIKSLKIENSHFINQHVGHHIKSRAEQTIIINSDIQDGPTGDSSYLIDIPNGGGALIQNNTLGKSIRSKNLGFAIMIGEEGETRPKAPIVISGNRFSNETGRFSVFVRNETQTPAQLSDNTTTGASVRLLEGR